MKTTSQFIRVLFVCFVTALCFTACSPEDGTDGINGEQGEQGLQGEPEKNGNANVKIYTRSLEDLTWQTIGNSNSGYLRMEVPAPNVLTNNVLQNSIILVYVYTSDFGGDWALVPYFTERNIRVQAEISTGKIVLKKDQDGRPSTQSWHTKIRVVIIEQSSSGNLNKTPPTELS